jgi:hypothetical protein
LAQETRAEVATAERLARSREVRPEEPGRVERAFLALSDERVLERLFDPRHGWFVRLGLPTPGAAPAAGLGWRASPPDRRYTFTASGVVSLDREWLADATLDFPNLVPAAGAERVFGGLSLSRSGRVANEFWGIGGSTPEDARAIYRASEATGRGSIGARLAPWFIVTSRAAWFEPRIRDVRATQPSVPEPFSDATAPGLARQPWFFQVDVALDVDYRDSIPSTRTATRFDQLPLAAASRGGRYQLAAGSFNDLDFDSFSFRRTTVDLQQFVPLLHGQRVLAFHAQAILNDAAADQSVPFYLMPTYGGISVGRGYPTFRFRDRNMIALQAEYRYYVNALMSGAVFADSGQVAPRVREFAWSRLQTTYGVGVRFGPRGAAALRLDLAFGGSGPTLVFGGGHAF